MSTTETLHPDARRRAELLVSRYAALTEANPGFHYHLHMRAAPHGDGDNDSAISALAAGADRLDELQPLVSDDRTFHVWRLRLEHPRWWIGLRVRSTTSLLAQLISELNGEPGFGTHAGITGYPGAHWFGQAKAAIKPLSSPGRRRLATALRRELVGRQLCMTANWYVEDVDASAEFPASEFDMPVDDVALAQAVEAAEGVHGSEWADAFKTMVGDLDPIIWTDLADALVVEVRSSANE